MANEREMPVYKRIADIYRRQILEGELSEGTMLPTQTELASMLGTSEVTVRKALQVLVHENLIYRVKKKGTFVRSVNDYVPNNGLHTLKRIFFVYNDVPVSVLTQEIHQSMIRGIVDTCDAHGIEIAFHNCHGSTVIPDNDPDSGYMLWGLEWQSMDLIEKWNHLGVKMVTLHNYFPHLEIPYVNCDNYTGGYLAAQHLLSLRHDRIGVILYGRSVVEMYRDWAQRLQGYVLALSNNGVVYDPELIVVADGDLESIGYSGMKKLLSLPTPPTAVFAAADFVALGAMKACEDLGRSIPEDISIIGYDGYSVGKYTVPALTTVNQNFHMLGKMGVEKLLDPSLPTESLVTPEIILRNSTRSCKPKVYQR